MKKIISILIFFLVSANIIAQEAGSYLKISRNSDSVYFIAESRKVNGKSFVMMIGDGDTAYITFKDNQLWFEDSTGIYRLGATRVTPDGSDGSIQLNYNNALYASPQFTFDTTKMAFTAGYRTGTVGLGSVVLGGTSGAENIASGTLSFVTGEAVIASGDYSTAMGKGATAHDYGEMAIGQFNVISTGDSVNFSPTNTALNIGGGTDVGSESTVFKVLFNGNTTIAGDLSVGDDFTFAMRHVAMAFQDSLVNIDVDQNVYSIITNDAHDLFTIIEASYTTAQGDSITIQDGGDYLVNALFTVDNTTTGDIIKIAIFKNGVYQYGVKEKFPTANDTKTIPLCYYFQNLVTGDDISFRVTNTVDGSNPEFVAGSVYIEKKHN